MAANLSCVLQCPVGDRHVHKDDLRKVWKECQEEGFWYRGMFFKLTLFLTLFKTLVCLFPGALLNSVVLEAAGKGSSITSLFS